MRMFPIFPQFRELELSDRRDIERIVSEFPPYSDFCFTNLWTWGQYGPNLVSKLNGNLVVRYSVIGSSGFEWTFAGTKQVNETATVLLEHLASTGESRELVRIPQAVANSLDMQIFHVVEDRSGFDYVLSTKALALMTGGRFADMRSRLSRIRRKDCRLVDLDLTDSQNRARILKVVTAWESFNDRRVVDDASFRRACFAAEKFAFDKLLSSPAVFETLTCFSLFVDGVISSFDIGETIGEYFVSYFAKSSMEHKFSAQCLIHLEAVDLLKQGVHFISVQEDLGIEGLRFAKARYRPVGFLKKYSVRFRPDSVNQDDV